MGGRSGVRRYRWDLPLAAWVDDGGLTRWRPAEAEWARRHPEEFAERLWTPPILAEHIEWLERVGRSADRRRAARARAILDEATPTSRTTSPAGSWPSIRGATRSCSGSSRAGLARSPMSAAWRRPSPRATPPGPSAPRASCSDGRSPTSTGRCPRRRRTSHPRQPGSGTGSTSSRRPSHGLPDQRNADGGWVTPARAPRSTTTIAVAELLGHLDPRLRPGAR